MSNIQLLAAEIFHTLGFDVIRREHRYAIIQRSGSLILQAIDDDDLMRLAMAAWVVFGKNDVALDLAS